MATPDIFKVYADPALHATVLVFNPPGIKVTFPWEQLAQLVTPEALLHDLQQRMLSHYKVVLADEWHKHWIANHVGQEGLMIPSAKVMEAPVFEATSIDAVLEAGIPGFHKMVQSCPVGGCIRSGSGQWLRDTIIHLNDDHQWPREQIAEWLR